MSSLAALPLLKALTLPAPFGEVLVVVFLFLFFVLDTPILLEVEGGTENSHLMKWMEKRT